MIDNHGSTTKRSIPQAAVGNKFDFSNREPARSVK